MGKGTAEKTSIKVENRPVITSLRRLHSCGLRMVLVCNSVDLVVAQYRSNFILNSTALENGPRKGGSVNPCDPTLNRPVPHRNPLITFGLNRHMRRFEKQEPVPSTGERPRTEQLPGQPKFNSLHISHLCLKVDGKTEHLFVAILNGEAVGQVLALKQEWGACGLRMLYVSQKHRHMGIGTRLVSRVLVFAHNEKCNEVEIAVHKGNDAGRIFWIRRKFIDDETRDMSATPDYRCMVKPL